MRRLRLAVIGLGRLGEACGRTILQAQDLELAGIVRRAGSLSQPPAAPFTEVPVAAGLDGLGPIDAALVCVPQAGALETIHDLLQHRVPAVGPGARDTETPPGVLEKLNQLAARHRVRAILDAGWDPGALEAFRTLFALLIPKGQTESRPRPGVSLHHTLTARAVAGVRDALCTELRSAEGRTQRYVYVELVPGADPERVTAAVQGEPLFLDEETLVFTVESVAALEEEGAGIVLERRGSAAASAHQLLLLEARFDRASLAAEVMVGAARSLPYVRPGAHLFSDLPLGMPRSVAASLSRRPGAPN